MGCNYSSIPKYQWRFREADNIVTVWDIISSHIQLWHVELWDMTTYFWHCKFRPFVICVRLIYTSKMLLNIVKTLQKYVLRTWPILKQWERNIADIVKNDVYISSGSHILHLTTALEAVKESWRIRVNRLLMVQPQNIKVVHNDDVMIGAMASQITSLTIVYSTVYSGADQKNIKAPRHWPLCGISPVTGEFPAQMASNAENFSIWWRHHAYHADIHEMYCI